MITMMKKRAAIIIIILLLVLLSCVQANCLLKNCCTVYHKLHKERFLRLLLAHNAAIRQKCLKKKRQREYWVAPGRKSAWWDNLLSGAVVKPNGK